MPDQTGKYYIPNKWARTILSVSEQMMNSFDFEASLRTIGLDARTYSKLPDNMKKQFSFEQMARLQQGVRDVLGERGMEKFDSTAGERIVSDTLSQFKSVASAAQVAMKFGSLEGKVKLGLEFFSKFFSSVSDEMIILSEDRNSLIWSITRCPYCWYRLAHEPSCQLAVGMVQGVLHWISPETNFDVRETECVAMGAQSCQIQIAKQSLS